MPYIIYSDTESLIKRIDGCANNPQKSSTTKIGEHIPCGYSMSTLDHYGIWSHRKINILYVVGKIVWKSFVLLQENMLQMSLSFKRKKMLPLTKKS